MHAVLKLGTKRKLRVFDSDVLMGEWSQAPRGHPSPITLRFLREKKGAEHFGEDSSVPQLSLTPNWKPYKASDVLTNAIYEPLNWCQRNPLLFDLIISLFLARRLCRLWLLLMLAQQKCGHPARLLDSISRLLVSVCRPLYYILPLI